MSTATALRTFVVRDEETTAITTAAILQLNGFCTLSFTSPVQALKSAGALAPDVVICDMQLPEIPGIELALHIKKLNPVCRILLLAGATIDLNSVREVCSLGSDFNLLFSPVLPKELLRELALLLADSGREGPSR